MQAVSFPGYGRAEIIDIPRPTLRDSGDAIVLVTTAAIGPWDVERFLGVGSERIIPGGEFAGIIVETGEDVTEVELDDLVANTVCNSSSNGNSILFGSTTLPGGHAEYVRVPNANTSLVKIAASGEERAVLSGGTVGMGVNAAALALNGDRTLSFAVVGCDPIGMTALVALKNTVGPENIVVVEDHPARKTLASSFAATTFSSSDQLPANRADVVIVGSTSEYPGFDSVTELVKPGGSVVFSEAYGLSRTTEDGTTFPEGVTIYATGWPTNLDAKKIVTAMQIRQLDLTPLVSHVFPLDEVHDAYEAAAGPNSGVQKVLLKP